MSANVVFVSGCAVSGTSGPTAGSADGSITFAGTGGATQDWQAKAWQKPFTAATKVGFVNDALDEAKLKAMVDAQNVSWDVVDLSSGPTYQYCGKYLEKLDFSVVDKSLYPADAVNDCGVPAFYYTQMFLYNTKQFGSRPPTSAADFFDTKTFPGKRMVPPEISVGLLEFALLADGVPKDKLYPLDVDRALAKLGTIKGDLVFADTYGQMQQALVGEQVAMALSLTSRTVLSIREGAPYDVVWDDVIVNWDTLAVPKGAPNVADTMKFIASVQKPTPQTDFASLASVIPTDTSVTPKYDAVQQKLDPFAAQHKDSLVYSNMEWWGQNLDAVTAKFTAWKVG
ncbi:extracellular solute-binding protein [Mycolicibacterium sp. CBM1]